MINLIKNCHQIQKPKTRDKSDLEIVMQSTYQSLIAPILVILFNQN